MKPFLKDKKEESPIKDRLSALIGAILEESNFDPMIKRVVSKMILNFLKSASDESIKEKIKELRDNVIPFILYGKAEAEHVEQSQDTYQD